ncbi:OBAP family protein [Oligoflexus tunisiensis]|uniref:OBAP family protein n=1 Tax=Oligoflexus tunisiensis TaxID=708132 RepID=UPI000ADADBD4|nr:OBAP family protein [Oligoflexus tunisiensis]
MQIRPGTFPFILLCSLATAPLLAQADKTRAAPPGTEKTTKTRALETGSKVLQGDAPVDALDIHLVGFHPMKEHPEHQMEAHHFCRQVNEDFAQCVLFDGHTKNANMNGIEYIISEKLFEQLPKEERQFWHPHNYEILSGQLVAPRLPDAAEKALMRTKMNSYGKTWHVWNTGNMEKKGDPLPYGEPMLAWSFNHDGEAQPGLVQTMEKKLDISVSGKRKLRSDLTKLAKPQEGVDTLKGKFKGPLQSIPGVQAK